MAELALIVVAATLVNNLVLVQSLGVSAFFAASARVEGALGMALVTGLALTLTAALAHVVDRYVLAPLELPYLKLIAFVAAVTLSTPCAIAAARVCSSWLRPLRDVPAPLVMTSSALLGVALLNSAASRSLVASLSYAVGAALGFGVALVLFAGLRERLQRTDVPAPFRGAAIAFVTAGILSLAFLGFAGFARL